MVLISRMKELGRQQRARQRKARLDEANTLFTELMILNHRRLAAEDGQSPYPHLADITRRCKLLHADGEHAQFPQSLPVASNYEACVQHKRALLNWLILAQREIETGKPIETSVGDDAPTRATGPADDHLVTLDQMAAMCGVNKKTVTRLRGRGALGKPYREGGRGKAHLWWWRRVRGPLDAISKAPLPDSFPKKYARDN